MATKKKMLQAAAGQAGGAALDITDVFSTYLYSGDATTRDIVNNIDLAGEGGLVWITTRNAANGHFLFDTERGVQKYLQSSTTGAEGTLTNALSAFNSDGFEVKIGLNNTGDDQASWTFRKAPKFFDAVTYTGNGSTQTLNHSLNSVPGVIIVKRTDATSNWSVYANTLLENYYLRLNSTDSTSGFTGGFWGNGPTSTQFSVGNSDVNTSGGTYVAYLFAHNNGDGEFGPDGDQDIIKCGSYYGGVSVREVNLGFEPQWVLIKNIAVSGASWVLVDNMRGTSETNNKFIAPNTNGAEASEGPAVTFKPTGFNANGGYTWHVNDSSSSSSKYIYIALRRGPLAPPESATEVFVPVAQNTTSTPLVTTGFPVDLAILTSRSGANRSVVDRLRGSTESSSQRMFTNGTNSETSSGGGLGFDNNTGYKDILGGYSDNILWNWKRAPGYFDVVAYAGLGGAGAISHNLSATPEMIWFKNRNDSQEWIVYHKDLTAGKHLRLNGTNAELTGELTTSFAVSDTQFTFANDFITTNASGYNYIAYLFASLDGISKVGSYTGAGSDQNIDCGFTSGARFVLIKRYNSTSPWSVFDSARGITSSTTDPYLFLNSTAAEATDSQRDLDPYSSGFKLAGNDTDINASGSSYIFYAIA